MDLYNDSLVLFGGFDGKRWLNDLHTLEISSLVWKQVRVLGAAPQPRQYHTSEVIGSSLYIFGGYNGSHWLGDLVILDLNEMKWIYPRCKGESPSGKEGHSMAAIQNYLYVFGGWNGCSLSELHRLDTATMQWKRIEVQGYSPRVCGHSMTVVKNQLFVFGGFDGEDWENTLFVMDPEVPNPTWVTPEVVGSPAPRGYHSATIVNRYILVYAGYNGQYILGDLVALDTESFTWSVPDPCPGHFPTARNAHTMALYGSELFIFGGYNGSRDTNELHVLETAAFSSMHDDFREALYLNEWKDIKLVSPRGSCLVHSAVVKARCPLLYSSILQNNPGLPETRKTQLIEEELGYCCQKSLEVFCEYLYCDICKDQISQETRDDLLFLAVKYDLPRLKALCTTKILDFALPDSTLALDISSCLEAQELSDLTIQVDSQKFNLHKVIMSARCPYFSALLNSGMKETRTQKVRFDNFSAESFEHIVEWIYSDKFSPLFADKSIDLELGVNLLTASNLLGLQSLMRMTEIALLKILNLENVVTLFEVSFTLGAYKLKSYCLNLVLKEFEQTSSRREFSQLSEAALQEINEYLPPRMRRQASHSANFNQEAGLLKFETTQKPSDEPVMVSGHAALIQHVKTSCPVKKLTIRAKNPSSPTNIFPSELPTNALPSSNQQRLRMKTFKVRKPKVNLKISGVRPSGVPAPKFYTPKSAKKTIFKSPKRFLKAIHKEERKDPAPDFLVMGGRLRNTLKKTGMQICSSAGTLYP
mmetsp:Transcript_3978/g.6024  ORF Transcript_3978/g.6024 Transcript_3978/m.6024 type:complete len:759 (+) Transcript_3978:1-2277(+)